MSLTLGPAKEFGITAECDIPAHASAASQRKSVMYCHVGTFDLSATISLTADFI